MADPCVLVPRPQNSCSITWDDPSTTVPPGLLQAHIRVHPKGGLVEVCPEDDCDDPDRGVAICLYGQSVPDDNIDPPICEVEGTDELPNPLRLTSTGKLWLDVRALGLEAVCVDVAAQSAIADDLTGKTTTVEYVNNSCETVLLTPRVRIKSSKFGPATASITSETTTDTTTVGEPPVEVVTGVSTAVRETFPCVEYTLDVDGEQFCVTSGAICAGYSGVVECDEIEVAPGETKSIPVTASAAWNPAPSGDGAPITLGEMTICLEPRYRRPDEVC